MTRPIEILLVEDSRGDALLTKDGLADARIANAVHHAWTGKEALDLLFNQKCLLDFVLLDLNLPDMAGIDILAKIKNNESHCHIPVVVMTTSSHETDRMRSYNLQAAGYITKPLDPDEFIRVIKGISTYWFQLVSLPHKS